MSLARGVTEQFLETRKVHALCAEKHSITGHTSMAASAAGILAELAGKVWTQGDLQILHTLHQPVVVTTPGLHSSTHGSVACSCSKHYP